MKPKLIAPMLALAMLSGCGSREYVSGYDIAKEVELAHPGNPSAIADGLMPYFQKSCSHMNDPAYDRFNCGLYIDSITLSLFDARRYTEASDFVINRKFPQLTFPENYDLSYLNYVSQPIVFEKHHKAISVLYYSLKQSNDPRAKDWVIPAFLYQDDYSQLPIVMTDREFLSDVERLLGTEAHREAKFYVANIKARIKKAQQDNANTGKDDNQRLADAVALETNAYEYAVKNKLSKPYLQYLSYKKNFGQKVLNDEYDDGPVTAD